MNKPFKDYYKRYWKEWIREETSGNNFTERAGNRKKPDWQTVLNWVSNSMQELKEATIIRSFEYCGLKHGVWSDFNHLNEKLRIHLFDSTESNEKQAEIS